MERRIVREPNRLNQLTCLLIREYLALKKSQLCDSNPQALTTLESKVLSPKTLYRRFRRRTVARNDFLRERFVVRKRRVREVALL